MKGSNAKQNKAVNLRLVLTQIVTLGPISRADIARNTLLTKQTITNMVEALLAVNLVEEIGVKRTESAGKPSKMLCLNKHAAFTCAMRVSPNLLELGLYYLNGECHSQTTKGLITQPNAQDIKQELEKFIAKNDISFEAIFAGGLSIQTDQTDAISQHQVNQHLQSQLSELLNLPIALENTASACAAYQMLFGEAKTLHNFVYLHLGNKVEAAVVYDRQIMLGQNGLTGAIGDIFVTPDQDESTAELGTLNKYASINALKTFLDGCNEDTLPIEQLDPLSHPMCKKWITQATEPLRIAIHTLESLLNTQTIIIGSDISEACLDALISSLRPFIPSIAQLGKRDIVRLIKVPNIDSIALTGIATLPLHAALNNKNMQTLHIPPFWSGSALQSTVFSQ
ncbi:ROK family transcriptional regulator [Pseudoalteromonas umbrosa]|uniref:ROK family transcriptional regulator n=1 Tax=Pseudoalteromonas umbrosa TaxID=3048489 RepID=UPI0024C2736D|nr:ROK family transcriptional regulator [Pseudoalteromonas sp. B95]MDK1288539.1 ROK family transcriptional regulator [Pseudoalteromonas sp. B95]